MSKIKRGVNAIPKPSTEEEQTRREKQNSSAGIG